MQYFKNTELAKLYNVSEKSVRNWVDAAREGKLGLQLVQVEDRYCIANTSDNLTLVEELAQKGKKYKNSRGQKVVEPTSEFYHTFNAKEILDIISNLEIHHEIPYQYNYFNGGADYWDTYTRKLMAEETDNYLKDIIELLDKNLLYLDGVLQDKQKVNIVDIGVGNCLPVRKLMHHFVEKNQLNRYIAIDISGDMLNYGRQNIKQWFGNKVRFEPYIRDINYDRFDDLLIADSFNNGTAPINIVLYVGGTISSFRKPENSLGVIHDSMSKNDLFLFSRKVDSERSRRYFDFAAAPKTTGTNSPFVMRGKTIMDGLNIDPSLYEVEQYFTEEQMMRQLRIRLKVALSINFTIGDKQRSVTLNKGDSILLWRAKHLNTMEILQLVDSCDFEILQALRSRSQDHLMVTSKIKVSET